MIAVDTNLLVYAHREDSAWHTEAESAVRQLAESSEPWALPWPCIHEFLAIATHPRIYHPPTPLADALTQVDCWLESPSLLLLGETDDFWASARQALQAGKHVRHESPGPTPRRWIQDMSAIAARATSACRDTVSGTKGTGITSSGVASSAAGTNRPT